MSPRTADKNPIEIRYLLNQAGLTFAEVDRDHGLKTGTARATARYPHRAGEHAIAKALGVPPTELWPSRYRTDGQRLKPQPAANYCMPPKFPKRQKGRLA
ncbi:MAG: helix-turn-helix domain-containing protein [Rhodospirillales bacterium]|nr:helix-turn-helix domain-containing protein [Rhodospirillales bacterium]